MPVLGKTLIQCLWIGVALVGVQCGPVDLSGTIYSADDNCECRNRDKPVDCTELVNSTPDDAFFRIQIFCNSLRSPEPLQQLYKSLRTSAPKASLVITINQLLMDVLPARFLAGIRTHILHLNTTNIKVFDENVFEGFETRVLDMKTNTPVYPPLEAIKRIPRMGTLMLHGYKLEVVSKGSFSNTLSTLGLSSCGIRRFEADSIPHGLIVLNLNGNRELTPHGLQNVFKHLGKLRTLMLKDTGVHGFTKDIFNGLKNLISLYLVNCNIKRLDDDVFSTLPKLDSLYLGKNSLREFGFILGTNVSNLNVDDNNLTALDDDLFQQPSLRRLRSLNLNNNGFTEVPKALRHLDQLATLSLSGNHIGKLNWSAVNGMRKLRSLKLDHNELLTIEGTPELPDLWTLDLMGNLLEGLQGTIRKLSLGNLNLAANRIEKLSLDELPTTLRNIKLEGNPVHCDSPASGGVFDRQLFQRIAVVVRSNHGAPFKDCI